MGSKNLKAVVVRGTGAVKVGDASAFAADVLRPAERARPHRGQRLDLRGGHAVPRRRRQRGRRPAHAQLACGAPSRAPPTINSATLLAVRTKLRACTQCPLACRQVHPFGDHVCEGPEFETLGLCGANCGIADLAAVAAFNQRLRRARPGHDVDRRGRRPRHGPLRAGRGRLRPRLRRRGRLPGGAGHDRAARGLGRRAGARRPRPRRPQGPAGPGPAVKGLELPAYDPRGTFGMGLGYATSDRGACHMRAFTAGDDILGGDGAGGLARGQAGAGRRAAGLQRPRLDRRLVRQHVPRHRLPRRALPPPVGPRDVARRAHDDRAPGSGTSGACSTCARD